MREIGAIASYLISWFFLKKVIRLENGFVTLLVSLLFAFAVYALIAYCEHEDKGSR